MTYFQGPCWATKQCEKTIFPRCCGIWEQATMRKDISIKIIITKQTEIVHLYEVKQILHTIGSNFRANGISFNVVEINFLSPRIMGYKS